MASDAPPHSSSLLFAGKPSATSSPLPSLHLLDFNHPQTTATSAAAATTASDDEIEIDDDDGDDYDGDDDDRKPPALPLPSGQVTVAAVPMHVQPLSTVNAAARKAVGPPFPIDESRKLFQRLWTDEDEIELLRGFLDYNGQRGGGNQHHHDTTAFYDQIKSKLQLEFNKNQLVEKLRRLKKKYRNVVQKMGAGKEYVLKSPHDQATFEISKKIWGGVAGNSSNFNTPVKVNDEGGVHVNVNVSVHDEDDHPSPNTNLNFSSALIAFSPNVGVDEKMPVRARKRARVIGGGGGGVGNVAASPLFNQVQTPMMSVGVIDQGLPAVAMPNVIEETIRSCLSPIFKELLNGVMSLSNGARGVGGLAEMATMPFGLGFGGIGCGGVDLGGAGDEKWRNQQILELEVFSKRLELVQDRIKVQLEELRGKGS